MNIDLLIIHHHNQRDMLPETSHQHKFHNDAAIYLLHMKTLLRIIEANTRLMHSWVQEAEEKGIKG